MKSAQHVYPALLSHFRKVAALKETLGLLHWDQETMMPPAASPSRAEEIAVLEGVIHDHLTASHVQEWLASLDAQALSEVQRANVRQAKREVQRAVRLPKDLVQELARHASLAQPIWAQARRDADFSRFAPCLETLIPLKREEADALGFTQERYDALIDTYEPGATTAMIAELFSALQPALSNLVARIGASPQQPKRLTGTFETKAQLALARQVALQMGFDFNAGRLDLSTHPFTSGSVPQNVRITTRVDEHNFTDCLYSTMHEVGHALYEQGIDESLQFQPIGTSVSLGVHESQSRLWENNVGRGRAFATWLFPKVHHAFGEALPVSDVDAFYASINQVEPSFIRTEADEVTYNLHIIVRFELERALLAGTVSVSDLEGAWNDLTQKYVGLRPTNARLGVLQDVHWAGGAFGYFPTYTLGNVYSAELFSAAQRANPSLLGQLERGELLPLRSWLRDNIHRPGSTKPALELMHQVIGRAPNHQALVHYLEKKFGEIYRLT